MQEMEYDDEYEPTEEELAEEEAEEPLMMRNAEVWDNFLEYIHLAQDKWAPEDEDTDLATACSGRWSSSIWVRMAAQPPPPAPCLRPCSLLSVLLPQQATRSRTTSTR